MAQCVKIVDVATESLNIPLGFIVFSEIEAANRLLVERGFIDQKSRIMGRLCYTNQWIFNDFVLRRLIDVEDEKMRILRLARGFILKVDIRNDVRPKSFHQKRYKHQWMFNNFMFSEFIDKR